MSRQAHAASTRFQILRRCFGWVSGSFLLTMLIVVCKAPAKPAADPAAGPPEPIQCAACNKAISGGHSEMGGKQYHTECIKCATCSTSLRGKSITAGPNGEFLCQNCYQVPCTACTACFSACCTAWLSACTACTTCLH